MLVARHVLDVAGVPLVFTLAQGVVEGGQGGRAAAQFHGREIAVKRPRRLPGTVPSDAPGFEPGNGLGTRCALGAQPPKSVRQCQPKFVRR